MKTFLDFIKEEYGSLKHGNTTIGYQNKDDHVELYSIRTPAKHRGKGSAHEAMKKFTEKLDSEGKKSRLVASPLDKKTKTGKLVSFYRKHGYELTGETGNAAGDPWMERKPKK